MNEEEFKQWFAGFFDADGSVCFSKCKTGYSLFVCVSQSEETVLNKINEFYGGIFTLYSSKKTEKQRIQFNLRVCGKDSYPVLLDLEKYSVLKCDQVKKAIEFLPYIGIPEKGDERMKISKEVSYLNKNPREFQWKKPYEKINYVYLAGMFDGDGHVGAYNRGCNMYIAQKNYPAFLEYISTMYEGSNYSEERMYIYGLEHKLWFLHSIKDHVIYKKDQVEKAIEYLLTNDKDKKNLLRLQIKILKTIDIDLEYYKKYIENVFIDLNQNYSTEELILYNKYKQVCNFTDKTYSKKNIYINMPSLGENLNLDVELIFCELQTQKDLWMYYRNVFSSLDYRGSVGREVRILVRDRISNKYMGIFRLTSDFYSLKTRDEYFKSKGYEKNICERNTANISCCVPLQPFGWNCNGGKLLVKLAFSKEVKDYWENKYGDELLGLTTTSINGKSIQYDRLRELKFLGLTKGVSTYHIPEVVVSTCNMLYNTLKLSTSRVGSLDRMKVLFQEFKISQNYLAHKKQKGIYFGFYEKELKNVKQMTEEWYLRWCKKRCQTHNRQDIDIYTKDSPIFKNIKTYSLPEEPRPINTKHSLQNTSQIKRKEELIKVPALEKEQKSFTGSQYLFMIEFKNKISTQEMAEKLKEKFPDIVGMNRDCISKFWQGTLSVPEDIKKSKEYIEMCSNKKKRVYAAPKSEKFLEATKNNKEKRRLFTEEQLISILRDKKDYTLTSESCGKKYVGVNGKSIHRGTIENIWNGKLEPLDKSSIPEYDELIIFKRSRKEVAAAKLKE